MRDPEPPPPEAARRAVAVQPYVGPRPFEFDERDIFFGRVREADELASRVISHAAVLFYAQSGTGKSSLINAGLIPLLKAKQCQILPVARVCGTLIELAPERIPNLFVLHVLMRWAGD